MGYMKKYKCPKCLLTSFVIRKTKRKRSILYFCKFCKKYFSINTFWIDRKIVLIDHLDGLSFRDLSRKHNISTMSAWRICDEELRKLPNNNKFTFNYCNKLSSTMVVDGKYFNVVNDEDNPDWVLIWGIDYFYPDIPVITIAPSESYNAWALYFSYFRILNHYPQLLVCDDNINLKTAAYSKFPGVKIQACFNHFKENIRRDLKVRSDDYYKPFMKRLELVLDSSNKLSDDTFNNKLFLLYRDFKEDSLALKILTNIENNKKELLGYRGIPSSPLTTNLIEGLNGHLEQRLKSICSFQSINHAKLWLNGYVLKRRLTKYTDAKGKFRFLNGKCGVDLTKKDRVDIPPLF
jgi:hypothetical protein